VSLWLPKFREWQKNNLSIQPTSAKICAICGRQNFAAFLAKWIFQAKMLRQKAKAQNTSPHSSSRHIVAHRKSFNFLSMYFYETLCPCGSRNFGSGKKTNLSIQTTSAKICAICGKQNFSAFLAKRIFHASECSEDAKIKSKSVFNCI
jgi:hypothetical protein